MLHDCATPSADCCAALARAVEEDVVLLHHAPHLRRRLEHLPLQLAARRAAGCGSSGSARWLVDPLHSSSAGQPPRSTSATATRQRSATAIASRSRQSSGFRSTSGAVAAFGTPASVTAVSASGRHARQTRACVASSLNGTITLQPPRSGRAPLREAAVFGLRLGRRPAGALGLGLLAARRRRRRAQLRPPSVVERARHRHRMAPPLLVAVAPVLVLVVVVAVAAAAAARQQRVHLDDVDALALVLEVDEEGELA